MQQANTSYSNSTELTIRHSFRTWSLVRSIYTNTNAEEFTEHHKNSLVKSPPMVKIPRWFTINWNWNWAMTYKTLCETFCEISSPSVENVSKETWKACSCQQVYIIWHEHAFHSSLYSDYNSPLSSFHPLRRSRYWLWWGWGEIVLTQEHIL